MGDCVQHTMLVVEVCLVLILLLWTWKSDVELCTRECCDEKRKKKSECV
jgi:hypothetical protein